MTDAALSDRIQRAIDSDSMIRHFGIQVEETSEHLTRVSAVVGEDSLQLHDLAHGAFIFALLDVAFALTVNAKVDAVAVQWSISQFRSGQLGERLTAECRLLHGGRRLMVVDLVVTGAEGRVIARGQATAVPVSEAPPQARC